MAINYVALAAVAARLIRENGRDIQVATNSPDPARPWTAKESAPTTLKAVQGDFDTSELLGSDVQTDDLKFLIAAQGGVVIETDDILIDGASRYSVVRVNEVKPGGTPIYFDVQARA